MLPWQLHESIYNINLLLIYNINVIYFLNVI